MKTLFSLALGLIFSASVVTSSFACGDEAACKSKKTAQKECCKGKSATKCAADHKAEKATKKAQAKK
ncbi:MAG: hypothetical protein ACXWEY_12200 [Bacteroidia bacterium]